MAPKGRKVKGGNAPASGSGSAAANPPNGKQKWQVQQAAQQGSEVSESDSLPRLPVSVTGPWWEWQVAKTQAEMLWRLAGKMPGTQGRATKQRAVAIMADMCSTEECPIFPLIQISEEARLHDFRHKPGGATLQAALANSYLPIAAELALAQLAAVQQHDPSACTPGGTLTFSTAGLLVGCIMRVSFSLLQLACKVDGTQATSPQPPGQQQGPTHWQRQVVDNVLSNPFVFATLALGCITSIYNAGDLSEGKAARMLPSMCVRASPSVEGNLGAFCDMQPLCDSVVRNAMCALH